VTVFRDRFRLIHVPVYFFSGIDCNDMRKSMITFQFISTFAALIPFVDFSTAAEYHKLTEEEQQIRSVRFHISNIQ
jgi:hypothetical protein